MKPPVTIGERVNWYDFYADGSIVRDAGAGIVVEVRYIEFEAQEWTSYAILKDGLTDVVWYSRWEIETMEEYDERIKSQSENEDPAYAD